MTPQVSVLLPARDAEATLGEALASLAAQTLEDFELVLVDDGSRDGTVDLVRRAWGGDRRLRLLATARAGLVPALGHGLAACRAPLVARMDADDRSEPRRLELQVECLRRAPEMAICGTLVESFAGGAGIGEGYRRYDAWLNGLVSHEQIARELFVESPLAHPSVMFRRAAIEALGGYRDRGWPEDHDLWLRAARAGLRFGKVAAVLVAWRDHEGRASRSDPRYAPDAFSRLKAHHLALGPLAGRRAVVWGAGRTGRRLARGLLAEGASVELFVDIDPRKLRRRPYGLETIAPDALVRRPGSVLLASVAARGARELIRASATGQGWVEGDDFLCVA